MSAGKAPITRASSKPDAYVASNNRDGVLSFASILQLSGVTIFTWTIPLNEAAENFSLDSLQVNTDGSDLVVTTIHKESKEQMTFRKKVLDDGEFFQETPFKRTSAIGENKVEISGFKYTKELLLAVTRR